MNRCFVTPEDDLDLLEPYMEDWILVFKFEGEEVFGEEISLKEKVEVGDVVCLYYATTVLRRVKVLKIRRQSARGTEVM